MFSEEATNVRAPHYWNPRTTFIRKLSSPWLKCSAAAMRQNRYHWDDPARSFLEVGPLLYSPARALRDQKRCAESRALPTDLELSPDRSGTE